MNWIAIISAIGVLSVIGLGFGLILGVAAKKFAVEQDERAEKIRTYLGGANCGACGYAGCDAFANAVVAGEAKPDGCPASGAEGTKAIGKIMGISVKVSEPRVARVLCQGVSGIARDRYRYEGYSSCRAVASMAGGNKECRFACIGFGDCINACKFGGIELRNGVAHIDPDECKSCGECVSECPRGVIRLLPRSSVVNVRCRNADSGRVARDTCMKACIGCKRCEKECPYDAITVENNCAVIDPDKCTHCGACAKVCPCGCIVDELNN